MATKDGMIEPVSQSRVYEVGEKDGKPVKLTLTFDSINKTRSQVVLKLTGTTKSVEWETSKGIQSFTTPLQGSAKKDDVTPSLFKNDDWAELLKGDAFEALNWVARQLPDFDQKLIDSMKGMGFEVDKKTLEEYLKVMRDVSNSISVEKENPGDPKAKDTTTPTQENS